MLNLLSLTLTCSVLLRVSCRFPGVFHFKMTSAESSNQFKKFFQKYVHQGFVSNTY